MLSALLFIRMPARLWQLYCTTSSWPPSPGHSVKPSLFASFWWKSLEPTAKSGSSSIWHWAGVSYHHSWALMCNMHIILCVCMCVSPIELHPNVYYSMYIVFVHLRSINAQGVVKFHRHRLVGIKMLLLSNRPFLGFPFMQTKQVVMRVCVPSPFFQPSPSLLCC